MAIPRSAPAAAGPTGWTTGRSPSGSLEQEDLELATDRLVHFAHWITPEGMPKRFDTHFYLVETPPDHDALHDGKESVDSTWIRPADAVRAEADGQRSIIFPTLLNLKKLCRSGSVAEALGAARASTVVPVLPRVREGKLRIPAERCKGSTWTSVKDQPDRSCSGSSELAMPKSRS